MSLSSEFDALTEAIGRTVAKELSELRAEMKRLTEEHSAKVGELRSLKETYARQMREAVRREVSAARNIDKEVIHELRAEIDAVRRRVVAAGSEYSR